VIAKKQCWIELQLSKLKIVGSRIALTAIFFCLKETIRFLD
jgi:hypothetical protein